MHHEIYRIAHQLHAEGKKPSVALIRAKLTTPTSLPVIVQALQQWKTSPELANDISVIEPEHSHELTTTEQQLQQRVSQLEQQVAQLQQQMQPLLAMLQQKS